MVSWSADQECRRSENLKSRCTCQCKHRAHRYLGPWRSLLIDRSCPCPGRKVPFRRSFPRTCILATRCLVSNRRFANRWEALGPWNSEKQLSRCTLDLGDRIQQDPNRLSEACDWHDRSWYCGALHPDEWFPLNGNNQGPLGFRTCSNEYRNRWSSYIEFWNQHLQCLHTPWLERGS